MRASKQELRSRNEEGERATSPRSNDRDLNYRAFPGNGDETTPLNSDFRAFSTSINGMFTDPDHERVDCCAMACCGVLQADRDRYLITGITPPSCFRRFLLHICLPILIFIIAMLCAVKIPDPWLNECLSTGFVFCVIGYFIVQCLKGAWKRRQVRKDLLWSKYHFLTSGDFRQRTDEDSVEEERSGETPAYLMGQTRSDIKNAHFLCGCYATDRSPDHRFNGDKINICTRFFQCFTNACCGAMCGMHFQLCGICGVAQEARQLEDLLHAGYRGIDYITMEPYMEYYPAIYKARYSEEPSSSRWSRLSSWWSRLSRFSKFVLRVSLGFCTLLLIWSLLAHRMDHEFGPANFVVFCATLFQAYFLLTLVHWNHKQDVSTDALIKFFASGFCLSTTIAIFYELVVGLMIRLIMSILMAMSGIDVVEENEYTLASPGFGNFWDAMQETAEGTFSYKEYLLVYGKEHPLVYTIYLLIYSFFLAAMIEELCKYFGFRMVEHPDFLSRHNLEETAECQSVDDDEEEEGDDQDFPDQDRTLQSRGAAITVSMVAVSLGFACCENLVYIFVYGEAILAVEIVVLVARSLLPVHPIAAALQSVRVCQRDLEKKEKIKLGSVIFPGVMFHGMYDFFLMWIDFLSKRNANYATDDDEAIGSVDNSDAFALLTALFLISGASWYYLRESRHQRKRLEAIDRATSVDQSRLL